MALRVFNTLTRRKEDFEPLHPPKVGVYLCGPTVYSYSHIGHMVGVSVETRRGASLRKKIFGGEEWRGVAASTSLGFSPP